MGFILEKRLTERMSTDIYFRDNDLLPIWEKVQQGQRLTMEDGKTLFATRDIISLGKMAHYVQKLLSGDAVYFVLNQKIEPTNICVLSCKFCDFATKAGRPDAYEMTIHDILHKLNDDVHEVHITGGLHPEWKWEYYLEMLRKIKHSFPNVDLKAFTAVEIDFFHKKFKIPIQEVLGQLKEAGLRTLPGGGAEVFSERVRKLLFNQKIGAKRWLEIHKTAHKMGIPTNSTILYGHIETVEERISHLMKLRETQDETGGFLTFVPLAFQPGETGIKPPAQFTSAMDDLKMIAVSRLMLDNIPHIKAYWVMLTEEVASVALNFGADDMDGTVGGERIAHDAGALSPATLAKEQLVKIISDAGKIPIERDIYYNPLNVHSENVIGRIPYLNSVPFYGRMEKRQFKILPVVPRRMGVLAENGRMAAGLFSLMDYLRLKDELELIPYCIAARDHVKSVILFSNHGWKDLEDKTIGITDDSATSIRLLEVLLAKKYNVRASLTRMHSGVNNYEEYDAVMLIGDEALRTNKGSHGRFELCYDLASEWYDWQKLPFVFAVWAVQRSLDPASKSELVEIIKNSLERSEHELETIGARHAAHIGLTALEAGEYLRCFTYRFGDRESRAVETFQTLYNSTIKENMFQQHDRRN
jgi:aminodeoxyfutalosine synthase